MDNNVTDTEIKNLANVARLHANNLFADVQNASTRVEHLRITRLAVEAQSLAETLEIMARRPNIQRAVAEFDPAA